MLQFILIHPCIISTIIFIILLAFTYIVYEYRRAYREHDDYEDEGIKVFHMINNLYLLQPKNEV